MFSSHNSHAYGPYSDLSSSHSFPWSNLVAWGCFIDLGDRDTTAQTTTDFMLPLPAKYIRSHNINPHTNLMSFSRKMAPHGRFYLCGSQLHPRRCCFVWLNGSAGVTNVLLDTVGTKPLVFSRCIFPEYRFTSSPIIFLFTRIIYMKKQRVNMRCVLTISILPSSLPDRSDLSSANTTARFTRTSRRKLVFG